MMQNQVINLKSISKIACAIIVFAFAKATVAQTPVKPDAAAANALTTSMAKSRDTVKPSGKRFMVDGVTGVIGDYVILNSDIVREYTSYRRTVQNGDLTKCELMESILRQKMYAHHATQDSINVSDSEVQDRTYRTIEYFRGELGGTVSDAEIAKFYRKDNIEQVRNELNRINREKILATRMQERLTQAVEITPEEVRQFFYGLPEDQRPLFNTEVEIAQIVIKPQATEDEKQAVIKKLKEYRKDVLENGSSFAAKAALYSDDVATERQGGILSLGRNDGFVKEFKDAVFSLAEGEISEPFETQFGYHIVYVQKIRGQIRDVRHVLLRPFLGNAQLRESEEKLREIRDKIVLGELTFEEAAKKYSQEEETKNNGGRLINPTTGGGSLDLTKAPSELANQVQLLETGDISPIIPEKDQSGSVSFKIIKMINRIEDHEADYASDYIKIKDLALKNKQTETIKKWQTDKLKDTYIKIGDEFKECIFVSDWIQ
jgi:peptidyl-prolyl cis-trans isomerase SurA